MKILFRFVVALTLTLCTAVSVGAEEPRVKFYEFGAQVIDGGIKQPASLHVDSKARVKFDRLLTLKKSFLPAMLEDPKSRVFK